MTGPETAYRPETKDAMSLYAALAEAKTQGSRDGDFLLPNQKGIILLHGAIHLSRPTKQTAILVGEIVEAHAKVAGAVVQTPGTKVKVIYALSKYDWAINELKTHLVQIMGLDEKSLSPAQVENIMADVFEGPADEKGKRSGVPSQEKSILRGVLCTFDSIIKTTKAGVDMTKVSFGEVSEANGNTEALITERKAKLGK